jgi:hypothetical protein
MRRFGGTSRGWWAVADLYKTTLDLLKADATLTALVASTYILDDDAVGRDGLKLANIKAANQPIASPAIYLHWSTENPFGGRETVMNAVRGFLEVYFYQDTGYSTIEDARRRVWQLLHQKRVAMDDGYLFAFVWAGDVTRRKDPAMDGVSMERTRFEYHYIREA